MEGKDTYKPTFGTGDVVHDCPKHVQEMISGKKGKVVAHSLNEAGQVNYVDVDFGTGKVYHDIPTKKLKILEGRTHEHATKAEPHLSEADAFKPGDVFGGGGGQGDRAATVLPVQHGGRTVPVEAVVREDATAARAGGGRRQGRPYEGRAGALRPYLPRLGRTVP